MYGNHVTTIEAQTQIMVRNALRSQVPVPGVLGWVKDGGDTLFTRPWLRVWGCG